MALMRTSRKATTGPGDPKKKTGIKPKVTTTPEVKVTGKMEKDAYKMTAKEQYDRYATKNWATNYSDIGSKTKTSILTAEELKDFRKSEREGHGSKLIPKVVRVSPTISAKDRKSGDNSRLGQYQVEYFDPGKDKAVYERDSRQRYAEEGSPVMKTRKAQQLPQTKATLISPKKKTEMVSKAIEAPGGKTRQVKNTPRVGGPIQKNKITKTKLNIKGQVEGAKYRKEAKLAGSYERTKALVSDREGMGLSPKNKNKQAMLKDFTGELKSARKSATDKRTKTNLTGAIKDVRKSQKFEKKDMAGKTKYFTKSKLADTVEKKPSSKGVYQAGKLRYK